MAKKFLWIALIVAGFFGGIEIGYIYSMDMRPESNSTQEEVSIMMQDTAFRSMVLGELAKNPKYKVELVSNPQTLNVVRTMQTMEIGGRLQEPLPSMTSQEDPILVIENMEKQLDMISIAYKNGDKKTAYSLVNVVFIDHFEDIERNIAAKDQKLSNDISVLFRSDLRDAIRNGDTQETIDAKISLIKKELDSAKLLFS